MKKYLSIAAFILLSACAGGSQDLACKGEEWTETRLFFGMSIPGGGEVSESQWTAFVDKEIVPVFAEGFTVADGQGFWKDTQTTLTITEKSKMVIRVHPAGNDADEGITRIIDRYKAAFRQQSVMRVDGPSCVYF